MFDDESHDADDGAREFDRDALIETIRHHAMEDDFDWQDLQSELVQRLDGIVLASDKLEYGLTAIEASCVDRAFINMILPSMAALYPDLEDADSRLACAALVARHGDEPSLTHPALTILQDEYRNAYDPVRYQDALELLLNDPRPFSETARPARAKAHMAYYAEWWQLISEREPAEKAYAAFDLLSPGRLYNGFKPELVGMIFENIRHVRDPLKQIDMILLCNQALPAPLDGTVSPYQINGIDKDVMPKLYGVSWEPLFHQATLKAMSSDEGPCRTIHYLVSRTADTLHTDWVVDAAVTMAHLLNTLEMEDFKQRHRSIAPLAEPLDFNPRSAADFLKRPQIFLDWSAQLHDIMYEDMGEGPEAAIAQGNETDCFYQLSSAYDQIKQQISRSKYKSLDKRIAYCQFKHDFLMAACTGEAVQNVESHDSPLNNDVGLWPTVINYANQQLDQNHMVWQMFVAERAIIAEQKRATDFNALIADGDERMSDDTYFDCDPEMFKIHPYFKTHTLKGDKPYADRGEHINTQYWTVKEESDGLDYQLATLDLTLRPN